MPILPLSSLKPGQQAVVDHLDMPEDMSLKLIELGFCPGESIRFIRKAPFWGPLEIELMEYRLCIRKSEGDLIYVRVQDGTHG